MQDIGNDRAMRQMPPSMPRRMPMTGQAIVAFDFDGTLTVRDSFTAFLQWRAGPLRWALGLIRLIPAVAAYALDRDRGRIKAASVRIFLGGVQRAVLAVDSARFADAVWYRFMRPDALACWNDWGARGAFRVIVTASPAITVAPFARRLGAEAILGTSMVFDESDRVTGAFEGANCRGEEKVRRLREAFGDDVRIAAAYGDTSGDTEMLAMAEVHGYRQFIQTP